LGGHQHSTTHAGQILGGRDPCNSCSTDAYDNINWLSFQSYSGIPNAQPLLFFDKIKKYNHYSTRYWTSPDSEYRNCWVKY